MQVTVVQFGRREVVEVPEGSTLKDVLEESGIDPDSTIRFKGETVDGEQIEVLGVAAGDTVVAAAPDVSHGGGES